MSGHFISWQKHEEQILLWPPTFVTSNHEEWSSTMYILRSFTRYQSGQRWTRASLMPVLPATTRSDWIAHATRLPTFKSILSRRNYLKSTFVNWVMHNGPSVIRVNKLLIKGIYVAWNKVTKLVENP